jgi:hypothetical protein
MTITLTTVLSARTQSTTSTITIILGVIISINLPPHLMTLGIMDITKEAVALMFMKITVVTMVIIITTKVQIVTERDEN